MAHELRRAGHLVVFLNCKDFSEPGGFLDNPNSVSSWPINHLSTHNNANILKSIPMYGLPTHSLFDMLELGWSNETFAFTCLTEYLESCIISAHPVLLCLDQYNSLITPEQRLRNPIARLFYNWNSIHICNGAIVFAYASGYNDAAPAEDGYSLIEHLVHAFTLPNTELKEADDVSLLVTRWIATKAVDPSPLTPEDFVRRVVRETNGLPREVTRL